MLNVEYIYLGRDGDRNKWRGTIKYDGRQRSFLWFAGLAIEGFEENFFLNCLAIDYICYRDCSDISDFADQFDYDMTDGETRRDAIMVWHKLGNNYKRLNELFGDDIEGFLEYAEELDEEEE